MLITLADFSPLHDFFNMPNNIAFATLVNFLQRQLKSSKYKNITSLFCNLYQVVYCSRLILLRFSGPTDSKIKHLPLINNLLRFFEGQKLPVTYILHQSFSGNTSLCENFATSPLPPSSRAAENGYIRYTYIHRNAIKNIKSLNCCTPA